MQTAQQVLDTYFLDIRHGLLEVGAFLDRYDAAVTRSGRPDDATRHRLVLEALAILADPATKDRAETLLNHFSDLDPVTQTGENRHHPF